MIYYLNYYPTGKLKTDRFQPAKALFPNELFISNNVAVCVGLYFGDGQKSISSKSYQSTRFANSEPKLIKEFLLFMKSLGAEPRMLKAYLRISENLTKTNEEYINFWSKITKIPQQNFYKVGRRKNKYKNSKVAPHGTLTIIYDNSSFRLVFDSIYQSIKEKALLNKTLATGVMKGIIAADGCVSLGKRFTREISVAAKEKEARDYIRKLLLKVGLYPNKDSLTEGHESIGVTGYSNLRRASDLGLCDVHPEKAVKLRLALDSYKTICYRKGKARQKIIRLLKTKEYSVTQLARVLGRKENAIRRYLYVLEKEGLVSRTKRKKTAPTGRHSEVWKGK